MHWKEKTQSATHEVDPKLLEILVCPATHTTLKYDKDRQDRYQVDLDEIAER